MNLTLKRFYQSVDLGDPEKVNYFLALETEEGEEILLPVQKETTEVLIQKLYANKQVAHEEEQEEELEKEASSEDEDPPEEAGEEPLEDDEEPEEGAGRSGSYLADLESDGVPGNGVFAAAPRLMKKKPASEEEVPSL